SDRLRAPLGQRDVVFLGARGVGVADEVDALALVLLDARRVAGEPVALAGLDRRIVEREVHGGHRAGGIACGGGAGLAAQPVDAVFVVGALGILGALLGAPARAGFARTARAALAVGRARLALAGLADLARRARLVVEAFGRCDAGVVGAALAAGALIAL